MEQMFYKSEFNQDISSWDTSNVEKFNDVFAESPMEDNYSEQAKFRGWR